MNAHGDEHLPGHGPARRTGTGTMVALLAAAVLAVVALGGLPDRAMAADAAPCATPVAHASFGQVQFCPLWMPRRGSVPVHALDGGQVREVGRLLRAGRANWFVCQTAAPGGRTIRYRDPSHPAYANVWWARTLSDTGAWGWVNEVHFEGGGNDERDAVLRVCTAAEAGVTGAAPPAPQTPAPQTPAPPSGTPAPPAPPGPASAPPRRPAQRPVRAQRPKCLDNREDESAYVRYRLTSQFIQETDRATPARVLATTGGTIGSILVGASTCKTPGGWRVMSPVSLETEARGQDPRTGEPAGPGPVRGWGVAVRGARNGQLDVVVSRCRAPKGWTFLKELVGLPWPIKKLTVAIGVWAGGKALPADKLSCREAGSAPLTLAADSNGHLTASSPIPVSLRLPSQPRINLWHTVEPEVLLRRDTDPGSRHPRRPE